MDTTEVATRIATHLLTPNGGPEGTRLEIKQWQFDGTEKSLEGWCKEALIRVIKEELNAARKVVRKSMGVAKIDRSVCLVDIPCFAISDKLNAAGFPLRLGFNAEQVWKDDARRHEKFRDAAKKIGATWWTCHEELSTNTLVFEWGN